MKQTILAVFAMAGLATAGQADFGLAAQASEPVPAGGSFISNFFIGASVGYLHESEEEMYHLQLGIDLQPQLAGMTQSIFLEIGYNELEFFGVDQEIIPVTLNYKLERPLFSTVSAYIGAGAGVAFYDVSGAVSDDDEVFWGQIFGGLVVNVNDSLEIFGGVRGVFLDEVDINGFTTESGDDLLWEIGARYNF